MDDQRVFRRRRGPLQLALGGVLVVLALVVEVLIFQAYGNVNRTTVIFSTRSYVAGFLVNAQREAALLNVKIEELPTTRDVRAVQLRQALLRNHMRQLQGSTPVTGRSPRPSGGVDRDLRLIDQALAEVKANPTEPALRPATARMRPAIRRVSVRVKQLYDAKEQGFFGALSGALNARQSSERLLVGLSGLVLFVGLALALVHPDDRERVARFVAEAALRPGVTPAETWRVRHRDGTWLHSETVAANLLEDPTCADWC